MRWKVQAYVRELPLRILFLFSKDNIPQHETFQSLGYLVIIRQQIENSYVTFKEFTLYSSPGH